MKRRHLIIPDTQVKPGVPLHHMRWIGQAIQDYQPDRLIHLGDHWDFASVSRHSLPGSTDKEGQRIKADIDAGNKALLMLHDAMGGYEPKTKVILRGNHEQRLATYVGNNPALEGVVGFHLLNDRALGWDVVDYFHGSPKARNIDGIMYAHYFANPNSGQPIGGTIQNRLSKIGHSFVQGHQQGLLQGNVQYATGDIKHGIVAGSAYLHDEEYKGMANQHWRGIVVLNEVEDGQFSEMPLTLDYLSRKYEGMSLNRYMQRNHRNAKELYSVAQNKGEMHNA
jgi:hypothetical protein